MSVLWSEQEIVHNHLHVTYSSTEIQVEQVPKIRLSLELLSSRANSGHSIPKHFLKFKGQKPLTPYWSHHRMEREIGSRSPESPLGIAKRLK
jgi:hypothetical protein